MSSRAMKAVYSQFVVIGCACVLGCGRATPAAPTPPTGGTSAFVGTWVPTIAIDSCTGSHECIGLTSTWFVARFATQGSRIIGSTYLAGRTLDVNGSLDAAGQLVISAIPTPTFSLDELHLQVASSRLSGTVRYSTGPMSVAGHVTSAKHGPLESTDTTAQGTWIGNSLVRSCSVTGLADCPLRSRLFRLTLIQNGTAVSGNLDLSLDDRFRISVRGSFSGSMLTLSGTSSRAQTGGTFQQRLLAWSTRTDAFGRLTGTFTLEEEMIAPDHHTLAHYESDLQDAYLLPDWFQPETVAGRVLGVR